MKTKSLEVLLCLVTFLGVAYKAEARAPEPEHTIWVQLETEPTGATIYALPDNEMAEPTIEIGRTPYTVAVDLNWNSGLFGKKWNRMNISSPGNICRAVLQPDNTYDMVLSFVAVKDGYADKRVQQRAMVLKHPGRGWEGKSRWPDEAIVKVQLDRQSRSPRKGIAERRHARKIILADSDEATEDGTAGTLKVRANVQSARIYVDKKYVGEAPMQVIMKDGQHVVEVRKQGFSPITKTIYVNHDAEVTYDARLQPLTE